MTQKYYTLEEKYKELVKDYNGIVDDANAQISTLQNEKKELLDALEKSGKPGVFADLLRARNT